MGCPYQLFFWVVRRISFQYSSENPSNRPKECLFIAEVVVSSCSVVLATNGNRDCSGIDISSSCRSPIILVSREIPVIQRWRPTIAKQIAYSENIMVLVATTILRRGDRFRSRWNLLFDGDCILSETNPIFCADK